MRNVVESDVTTFRFVCVGCEAEIAHDAGRNQQLPPRREARPLSDLCPVERLLQTV